MHRLAAIACAFLAACTIVARYTTPPEACHNGADDDADGLKDCADPECACEDLWEACKDFADNDRDGLEDAEEPFCWAWAKVTSRVDLERPPASETAPRTCSSLLATNLGLDAFVDRDGVQLTGPVRLAGGEQCAGLGLVSETCGYLHAVRPMSGGPCWSATADVDFVMDGREVEIVLVLAPAIDRDRPPLGTRDGVVIGLRYDPEGGEGLELRGSAGGPMIIRDRAGSLPGPLRLRVGTGPECDGDRLRVEVLGDDGSAILDLGSGIAMPADWSEVVLAAGLQAAAPGAISVSGVNIVRERHDPCGYAVPQITARGPGDDDARATVLGAARGGGRICAVGVTPSGRLVERTYDPLRDEGTPPALERGDAELPSLPFASWWTQDLGIDSFSGASVEGPFPAATAEVQVRSAALAWNGVEGEFEAILLVSDEPQAGGALVRATSTDCAQWSFEALPSLDGLGAVHPVLYDIDPASSVRRVVLAEPGGGYTIGHDPACAERPVQRFPADSVPRVKPWGSMPVDYPRAGMVEVSSSAASQWDVEAGGVAFPTFPRWRIGVCQNTHDTSVPDETWPAAVSQMMDRGGYRAFVTSGKLGLGVVVDERPDEGVDGDDIVDARPLAAPLLAPSGLLGTFDAAAVRDGVLLLLDNDRPGEQEALLFYRGFRSARVFEDEDRVRYEGGAVGVVPVRFERAIESDEPDADGGVEEP